MATWSTTASGQWGKFANNAKDFTTKRTHGDIRSEITAAANSGSGQRTANFDTGRVTFKVSLSGTEVLQIERRENPVVLGPDDD